jgi:O-antigen ligase
MIVVLILFAILLSLFCSFVLKKQHLAVLLVVVASSQMPAQAYNVIYAILVTAILQFFFAFFKAKQNKSFLLILLLPITYVLTIFLIQPYKINTHHYFGYLAALFIFAWVTLIKWNSKEIANFLSIYGSYLILTGFIEKAFTDTLRVGASLTVATAYAVVLVITWTIWITICLIEKIYTKKIIALGTFLVFVAIIFSGTRMGLAGIVLGFALCGLFSFIIKKQTINIIKISIYSLCIFVVLAFLSYLTWSLLPNDLVIKKSLSSLIAGKLDNSNMGRILMWFVSINTFEQNKFFGIGAGNFPQKVKTFLQSMNISRSNGISVNENTHSHNILLMVLVEHGIIGFLILGSFVFSCLLQAFLYFLKNKQNFEVPALFAGFIVMAVLGLVDSISMYLPTVGFAAWFLGVCASFKERRLA